MSDSVKNLGVTLDCLLTMKTHISNLVCLANFELHHISSLLSSIHKCHKNPCFFFCSLKSRFDCCNSVLRLSSASIKKPTKSSKQCCSPCHESS